MKTKQIIEILCRNEMFVKLPNAFLKEFKTSKIVVIKDNIKKNQSFDAIRLLEKLLNIRREELLNDKKYKFRLWINELETNHNLFLGAFLNALQTINYKGKIIVHYVGLLISWRDDFKYLTNCTNDYGNLVLKKDIKKVLNEPNVVSFPTSNRYFVRRIVQWREFTRKELSENQIYVNSTCEFDNYTCVVDKSIVFARIKKIFNEKMIKEITLDQFVNYCYSTEPEFWFINEWNFGMLSWNEYKQLIQEMVENKMLPFKEN